MGALEPEPPSQFCPYLSPLPTPPLGWQEGVKILGEEHKALCVWPLGRVRPCVPCPTAHTPQTVPRDWWVVLSQAAPQRPAFWETFITVVEKKLFSLLPF